MLELRILGPLEVLVEGEPVELRRAKQRGLLALLLLSAGEVVSADRLIEELWAGTPPPTAKDALQNYVSQLRKTLGRDVIATRSPGYILDVDATQTDVGRFEQLVETARAAEDAESRAGLLREALSLWRGPALADLAYEGFAAAEAARLEELRAAVREDLIDAELELGRHADLVPELEELVELHPFDERARAQLMLALYRAGRQADALEAFQEARRTLAEELGLEPSPALRELERAILMQEPSLVADEPGTAMAEERLKAVTVLSGALTPAEQVDPERLRAAIARGIAAARTAVERHEGWITTRAGDELLGVFGVPVAHEDDALRATRAAVELREAIAADELALELRVGIETGQVLTGHGFVSGDVMRIAGHLQRSAGPGEIVVGKTALALVRHGIEGRGGKTGFRLAAVKEDAPIVAGYPDAPLVGRDRELEELHQLFGDVVEADRPRLLALTGDPGIGKSRLARELAALVEGEATVVTGRCVAYGEGATYLPLREMVSAIDLDAALAAEEDAALVARRVAELVGLAEGTSSVDEGLWAARRLFSALAARQPLVLVFEDLHLAEQRLLDLVDQLAERATGPMLILCAARPELLDARERFRESALVLEPLDAEAALALAVAVAGDTEASVAVVALAEGNPLFVEQLLAYSEERGAAALETVPPTIDALLAARIDLLDAGARSVAQRAALVGREFSRQALAAVSPAAERAALSGHVLELVRRGLIHPTPAATGHERYRFHHALVRDVAYGGLPKGERAELHETYGDWLGGEPEAADEVVGYHLEQAYRYRTELGPADRRAKQLAADAGARFGAAGMHSWRRGDVPTTIDLLGRATSLLPENDAGRRELLCELGVAFDAAGDTAHAEETLSGAVTSAEAAMDARNGFRARLELAHVAIRRDTEGHVQELLEVAGKAISTFEELDDDRGLGRAWLLKGWVLGGIHGQHAAWGDGAERALVHYRWSGFPAGTCLGQIAAALYYGPVPVSRAVSRCEELLLEERTGPIGRANVDRYLGGLMAMTGAVKRGRDLVMHAAAEFDDLGQTGAARYCNALLADIELLAGDVPAAREALQVLCRYAEESQDFGLVATAAPILAEALHQEGDYEAAGRWVAAARTHAATSDLLGQIAWRSVAAKLLAQEGRPEADAMSAEAVRRAQATDALNARAAALMARADVLHAIERPSDANDAIAQALALYEQKGNLAAERRARALHVDRITP